jgi:hypothetical protein
MKKGRTPLKNPPLHNPGESLQKEFDALVDDKAMPYIIAAVMASVLAGMEWVRYWTNQPPHPIFLTILALIVVAISWRKLSNLKRRLQNVARGIQAEKSVGQYLEQFRAQGYQIFHDIPGESGGKKFNLDHVIIGPKGIFTIETKYARKPEKGRGEVHYDGRLVTIQGFSPDRDPVEQAQAQARWLYNLLKDSTGKSIFVKPVVVFPGWYVKTQTFNADVWVINEKALASFMDNQSHTLSDTDIHLASFHLSQYIQSTLK